MLIRVVYRDGRHDMVKPHLLNRLLAQQELRSFRRTSGWAVIGIDPLRDSRPEKYNGPERRNQQ